jgi:small nuclear ribonucleoprotein
MTSNEKVQNLSEIDKLLQKNVEKEILVKLKNNVTVKGKLTIFDQHLNLTLKKGEVVFGEKTEVFEAMLVRGSDIMVISVSDHPNSKGR